MRCFLVDRDASGAISAGVAERALDALPPGDMLIRVAYSSLNYKDALAARGHRGVVSRFPHVPGIDVAGAVVESASADWRAGDNVIVTSYNLGAGVWGGYAEFVRVPAEWVVPLPDGLTPLEAMSLGTAGFTAAMCVTALRERGRVPEMGEAVVTGATGGVGCLAVALLAKLGYRVAASTGKPDAEAFLKGLGAESVLPRSAVDDKSDKPLLAERWSGAVDTVGGNTLSTLLRSTKNRGVVAACGLVGGTDVHLSVYPFLLRGVRLEGIDSAWTPMLERRELWRLLANEWKLTGLDRLTQVVSLFQLPAAIDKILAGSITGRVVVDPNSSAGEAS